MGKVRTVTDKLRIVVLQGDETGQELLEQAERVLDPELLGLDLELVHFDLSLDHRRETSNGVVTEAAAAMREAGLGLKAATITPEGKDDVGSPNRILREEVDGKVIIRTGRRLPGVSPVAGVHYPISIVRMAVDDAYGAKESREGDAGSPSEVAYRTEHITRSTCRAVCRVRVPHRRGHGRARLRRSEVDRLPRVRGHAQGGDGRRRQAASRHRLSAGPDRRDLRGTPVGSDRRAAGDPGAEPRRRLPLGSDACRCSARSPAAESVLLPFDEDYKTTVAMAEAPHGTAPALLGKDVANPLAMILACGARAQARGRPLRRRGRAASSAIYEAALDTVASGVKTHDLGGDAGTTEFTDAGRRAGPQAGLRLRRRRTCGPADAAVPSEPFPTLTNICSSLQRKRLRAWMSRFEDVLDDVLGDPPVDARHASTNRSTWSAHPHRKPLRPHRRRRPGSVAPAPAVCISPVARRRGVTRRGDKASR